MSHANRLAALELENRLLRDDLVRHQNEVRYQERRADRAERALNLLLNFVFSGKLAPSRKMTEDDRRAWENREVQEAAPRA